MWSFIQKLFSRTPSRRVERHRARLQVEALENRTVPSVFMPSQVRHAYGFDQVTFTAANGSTVTGDGAGQTIAIVDAYDDPNIASDLKYFDKQFGLPDPVFTKATPQGTPGVDSGWAMEIALDVEWAHAIAPKANILLVEAKSSNLTDLLAAVDYARKQAGVSVVSMSWGGSDFSGESAYDSYFTTPAGHNGVTFVASSGDSGARNGASWPAVSKNVLAVGGTRLTLTGQNNWYSETGWSGSGGGYSNYESEPSYQQSVQSSGKRSNPDVAYDGDPNSAFYVYDTVPSGGYTGWFGVGGTSAGAPQWAALVAIANEGRVLAGKGTLDGGTQTLPAIYSFASSDFHDITSGNNGYGAKTGYDLVTGRGSPLANKVIADLVKYAGTGSSSTTTSSSAGSSGAHFWGSVVAAPVDVAGSPGAAPTAPTMGAGSAMPLLPHDLWSMTTVAPQTTTTMFQLWHWPWAPTVSFAIVHQPFSSSVPSMTSGGGGIPFDLLIPDFQFDPSMFVQLSQDQSGADNALSPVDAQAVAANSAIDELPTAGEFRLARPSSVRSDDLLVPDAQGEPIVVTLPDDDRRGGGLLSSEVQVGGLLALLGGWWRPDMEEENRRKTAGAKPAAR